MRILFLSLGLALACSSPASAEVVGKIGTDWTGNDIVVEAVTDPKVEGVTCHLTYFSRGVIDRVIQGNVFEDPSNSAISCRQTGPIQIGDIDLDRDGEEIFKERRSLVLKKLAVRRIFDRKNNALVYVSHTRQVKEGSAKMSVSTVPLYQAQVSWAKGEPR